MHGLKITITLLFTATKLFNGNDNVDKNKVKSIIQKKENRPLIDVTHRWSV